MSSTLDAAHGATHAAGNAGARESREREAEFCYEGHGNGVRFTDAATARHGLLRLTSYKYLIRSRFFVLLTAPVIWMCAIPIMFTDVIGTIYQSICFPIYGIPKVRRSEYVAFDRHHLAYLNFFEKVNCEYCAYVNGILAYFTEIAARTEQHWCPIKHAGCVKCAHSRYKKFVEFGDAATYRSKVEEIRRAYQDIVAADLRKPGNEPFGISPGTKVV
jgi:hypothetical protein